MFIDFVSLALKFKKKKLNFYYFCCFCFNHYTTVHIHMAAFFTFAARHSIYIFFFRSSLYSVLSYQCHQHHYIGSHKHNDMFRCFILYSCSFFFQKLFDPHTSCYCLDTDSYMHSNLFQIFCCHRCQYCSKWWHKNVSLFTYVYIYISFEFGSFVCINDKRRIPRIS